MNKFGQIKSNIESLMTESYGKGSFKNHMKSFKKNVIENEKLAEAYFLYDELSKKKVFQRILLMIMLTKVLKKLKT